MTCSHILIRFAVTPKRKKLLALVFIALVSHATADDRNDRVSNISFDRSFSASDFSGPGFLKKQTITAAPGATELGEFEIRRIKITPSAKLGYQRMGLDLIDPIPFEFSVSATNTYKTNSVEIKLDNMNLWIIEAGLELKIDPTTRIFVQAAGSIIMLQRLASFVAETKGQFGPSEWTNHQLDWLTIGAGTAFEALSPFSVMAGLKWDHFDLTLGGRRGSTNLDFGPYRNLNLTSIDVLSDLWIPYIGLGLFGPNYRISFIGTPVALTDVRVRSRLAATIVPSYMFWGEAFTYFNDPIRFIEANAEYSSNLWGMRLSFWGKGAGLSGKGRSDNNSVFSTTHPNLKVNIIEDGELSLSRYNFAGGLALGLTF